MSAELSEARREALAVRAETTIGLGVERQPDCGLCSQGLPPCPIHVGKAIAEALSPLVAGWLGEERAGIARGIREAACGCIDETSEDDTSDDAYHACKRAVEDAALIAERGGA